MSIKSEIEKLLTRKTPLTYEEVAEKIKAAHPEASTSAKTVQWYASKMRKEGKAVRVKLSGPRERRNWRKRPEAKPVEPKKNGDGAKAKPQAKAKKTPPPAN